MMNAPLILAEHVTKVFRHRLGDIRALDDFNFSLNRGEIAGIVGESGSGKSTFAKMLSGLIKLTSGRISFEGKPLESFPLRHRARLVQMIPQDWQSSLDPLMTIRDILREPLEIHAGIVPRAMHDEAIRDILKRIELDAAVLQRRARELSGGQLQRLAIARSLMLTPRCLIADEPTSSLDTHLRREVLNLLTRLVRENSLGLIVISHDIETVLQIAGRIYVLFRGRLVEEAGPRDIAQRPAHEYTKRLVAAMRYEANT